MSGIKNLLKISLFLVIITIMDSCKPVLVPEKTKEAFGCYAYNKDDQIKLIIVIDAIKNDTFNYIISKIGLGVFEMSIPKYEEFILNMEGEKNSENYISVYLDGDNIIHMELSHNNVYLYFKHLKISTYNDYLNIDGISYDSVYYLQDTVLEYEIYSSKNYGFIKIWNDTISYKFVR